MFNILIAEDDKHMRDLIKTILTQAGYNCKTACDGAEALLVMENSHIDLAVVDIMMPNMDGYEFTKTLRDGLCEIPVLMVTAKISHNDKKQGFLSGIDDFLAKPFDDEELLWRVKALLRRSKIAFEGQEVELTPKEFLLLYKLLSYPNQLFTKRQIMDEIWDFDTESDEHTVEVHINRLREKFKDNKDFSIKTIRGFGYMGINDYEKA